MEKITIRTGILFVFLVFLFMSADNSCHAASGGYEISKYHVAIQVHENATFSVREEITANFTEQRHGVKRCIPNKQIINRMDTKTNREKTYFYDTPVTDIRVEGAPFELSQDEDELEGYEVLKIGSPNTFVSGKTKYVISYTFDMGDDRFTEYDWFYFDLIGSDWDANIHNITFEVSFDKLADFSGVTVYQGGLGSRMTSMID